YKYLKQTAMSQYINQAQVNTADEVEPTMKLVKDDQKMEHTEITVHKNDDQDVYYTDADGCRHCYWCYVLLRNLKLYQRPWLYCRTYSCGEQMMREWEWSTISEQEADNQYDIEKNVKPEPMHLLEPILDEEGNAYCPRCHIQLKI
ncbi:unnamed protein product, partial [Meganyctiphanes norvegica]